MFHRHSSPRRSLRSGLFWRALLLGLGLLLFGLWNVYTTLRLRLFGVQTVAQVTETRLEHDRQRNVTGRLVKYQWSAPGGTETLKGYDRVATDWQGDQVEIVYLPGVKEANGPTVSRLRVNARNWPFVPLLLGLAIVAVTAVLGYRHLRALSE